MLTQKLRAERQLRRHKRLFRLKRMLRIAAVLGLIATGLFALVIVWAIQSLEG